jgi:hypothetical protein
MGSTQGQALYQDTFGPALIPWLRKKIAEWTLTFAI